MKNQLSTNLLVVCLMGPTASGKSAISLDLAQYMPCEIISVDSAMIYRKMNIGTAKPTIYEQNTVPHHLIDIIDPIEKFSVAQFYQQTSDLINIIHKKNKIPVLVGGTMMYFYALQNGLSSLPAMDPIIRKRLNLQLQQTNINSLHHELQLIDKVSASRIDCNDIQRILRALEVFYITNIPFSQLQLNKNIINNYKFINLTLLPTDRLWLHKRIEQRLINMIKSGFIDEVQNLLFNWPLTLEDPAMRCVGYRQAYDYLLNNLNYNDFYAKSLAATRQLAKRQLTWLRKWQNNNIIYCDTQNNIIDQIKYILLN